ncbi:hypothetical protein [Paraburkholderia unamae]|uniref:Uncharacterized protein n=1 Tax=Paraburkholderia unamae TaxID=219649 RepID=A0ACC6RGV7_9BURK
MMPIKSEGERRRIELHKKANRAQFYTELAVGIVNLRMANAPP